MPFTHSRCLKVHRACYLREILYEFVIRWSTSMQEQNKPYNSERKAASIVLLSDFITKTKEKQTKIQYGNWKGRSELALKKFWKWI